MDEEVALLHNILESEGNSRGELVEEPNCAKVSDVLGAPKELEEASHKREDLGGYLAL